RRQALRQGSGHHRAAGHRWRIRRRQPRRQHSQGRALAMLETLVLAVTLAIVTQDQTQLRAAPKVSAQAQAFLAQGEALEVRGERLDFLQVYDYRRERGGFVRANLVKRLSLTPEQAPELLAVVRFLRETPGSESLGIAYGAAYVQAASAETLKGPEG